MSNILAIERLIDFGALPDDIDHLVQRGVAAYRTDRAEADRLFRAALDQGPEHLPLYFCLYKIHTYQGSLDCALEAAEAGLREASRQAGWDDDYRRWTPAGARVDGPARFALYTLKALAFIRLRRDEPDEARDALEHLARLDPTGSVGWPVVADLANAVK
jgi:tetratricopeptide (TPR) repeat protein